jgi:hypothetical protein|tara:strand:+ start:2763 stop:4277 length:1515 start_codon:yes stop_codon:yes gene_type:complete
MPKLKFDVDSKQVKNAIGDYDKLSEKQQKAFKNALKFEQQSKKTGEAAAKAGKKGSMGWGDISKGILGANVAQQAYKKTVGALIREIEEFQQRQRDSLSTTERWSNALGDLQLNFKNQGLDSSQVDQTLKDFQTFAVAEGQSGGGKPVEILEGLTKLASASGGATKELIEVMREAIRTKTLSPGVDLADQGKALKFVLDTLRQTRPEATVKDASNVLGKFGSGAGGSVSDLVSNLPKLLPLTQTGKPVDQGEIFSLFALLTSKLDDTSGEESRNRTAKLFGKLVDIDILLKKQGFDPLAGERDIDKIVDFMGRINTGEFDNAKGKQVRRGAGLSPAEIGVIAAVITKNKSLLISNAEQINLAGQGKGADVLQKNLESRLPSQLQTQARLAAQGELEAAIIKDKGARGEAFAQTEILRNKRAAVNLPAGQSLAGKFRDFLAEHGAITEETRKEREAAAMKANELRLQRNEDAKRRDKELIEAIKGLIGLGESPAAKEKQTVEPTE